MIRAYAPIGAQFSGNDSYLRGCRYFPLAYRLRSSTNFLISDAMVMMDFNTDSARSLVSMSQTMDRSILNISAGRFLSDAGLEYE